MVRIKTIKTLVYILKIVWNIGILKMTFVWNNSLAELELKFMRFVNSNIVDIIKDMMSDGFDLAY